MDVDRNHLLTIEGEFTFLKTEIAHQTEFLEANHLEIQGIAGSIHDILSFYRNEAPRRVTRTHIPIYTYAQHTVNGEVILCGFAASDLKEVNLHCLRNRMCHEASLFRMCFFLGIRACADAL